MKKQYLEGQEKQAKDKAIETTNKRGRWKEEEKEDPSNETQKEWF